MRIKRRVHNKKPAHQGNLPYGVEYWYARFNNWTDAMVSPVTFWRNLVLGLLTVALIVVGANFLPFSDSIQSYFVAPASLLLFLCLLASTRRILPDEYLSLRERYSAAQRRRLSIPVTLSALAGFILLSSHIPYLLGGLIFLTLLFILYNGFRRTPDEVKMELAGITDPRDIPEEYDEDINEEAYLLAEEQLALEEEVLALEEEALAREEEALAREEEDQLALQRFEERYAASNHTDSNYDLEDIEQTKE